MATIKLGDLLVKANVLEAGQLRAALAEQKQWGGRLGQILVRMNLISEDVLVKALSKQLAIPAANLDAVQGVSRQVRKTIPFEIARDFEAVPLQLKDEGRTLVVAMSEPQNLEALDMLRARTGCRIAAQLAGFSAIHRALARFYDGAAALPPDHDVSFKVLDAQGRPVVEGSEHRAPATVAARAPAPAPAPASRSQVAPSLGGAAAAGGDPIELLRAVEEVQRKEISAIKAMVELLIERGVFTRDEYLAKVKR